MKQLAISSLILCILFIGFTNKIQATPTHDHETELVVVSQNDQVSLEWKMEPRKGDFHEIQHSTDGRTFVTLDYIEANGMSAAYNTHNYDPGINYYRIKTQNIDGTFTYSEIAKVVCKEESSTKVLPTSTTILDELELLVNSTNGKPVLIDVIDLEGKSKFTRKISVEPTIQRKSFDLSKLPSGGYTLIVSTDQMFQKFEIEKL